MGFTARVHIGSHAYGFPRPTTYSVESVRMIVRTAHEFACRLPTRGMQLPMLAVATSPTEARAIWKDAKQKDHRKQRH